jgi:glycosyltransferase involved in cell wall biosynthesis
MEESDPMRILFVSSWFPYPPDNGSRLRIYNLIKQLAKWHEIALVSFSRGDVSTNRIEAMRQYCTSVDVVPLKPFEPARWRALLGLFSPRPRSFVDRFSWPMWRLVESKAKDGFDLAIFSQLVTAPYVSALGTASIPRLFEEVELTVIWEKFVAAGHLAARGRYGLSWWKTRSFVVRLMRQFDGCTVVSDQEAQLVCSLLPDCGFLSVIPNGVDVSWCEEDFGKPQEDTLIYPGALTYRANLEAMSYFLRSIFPLIRTRRPAAVIRITGKAEGVPLDQLPTGNGVVLTGFLDDVRPAVAQSCVCVVPLNMGGGTRLKILEAMALGTPVVSTSKGAEGLGVVPGQDLLIADEPTEFAEAVVNLLEDHQLRQMLSLNGRDLVRSKYDWDKIGQQYETILRRLVNGSG